MAARELQETFAALRSAYGAMAALPVDLATKAESIGVLDELEMLMCQLPVQSHRLLVRLQGETTPKEMGAKSWRDVLSTRWRISSSEAGRRLEEAAKLSPRQALSGAPMEPVLPCTGIAQTPGLINREHVQILQDAMKRIPPAVDPTTRAQVEADLVRTAMGAGPKKLEDDADRTLFLPDQDGPEPDDTERARRRGVTKAPQQSDRMIQVKANLTPEAWANVDELAFGPDNRSVGPDGWTTRINAENDVEWIPPVDLDTGQIRVNEYHRPERLRLPPGEEPVARRSTAFGDSRIQGAEIYDEHPPDVRDPGGPEPNAA